MVGADAKLMDLCQRLAPVRYEMLFPFFTMPLTLLRNKKPLKGLPSLVSPDNAGIENSVR